MAPFEAAGGFPAALAIRLGIAAVTLLVSRRSRMARQVAFLGSATASLVTGLTAANVLYTGTAAHGVLLRASGVRVHPGFHD